MKPTTVSDTNRRNGQPGWLDAPAAAAYDRARAAGMPGGCLSDAGRTNAEQWDLWRAYLRGELTATAAYPGSPQSLHEVGNAIDLAEPARSWLRARPQFGFVRDTVPNEPWHLVYDETTDEQEDDDMAFTEDQLRTMMRSEDRKLWEEAAEGQTGTGRAMRKAVTTVFVAALDEATDDLVDDLVAALPAGALSRTQLKAIVENRARVAVRKEAQ